MQLGNQLIINHLDNFKISQKLSGFRYRQFLRNFEAFGSHNVGYLTIFGKAKLYNRL
jgi:hypothetical protein